MPYGFKLPGTDIVKVPNSGGGSDPTKLPLAGGTLSGLLNFSGTTHAGIRLNSLTTTQRNALTAGAGDFLLNTTLNQFQGYVSGAWVSLATLGANTFTSAQTFDATTGAIFPGSTSGNATVKAPAIAGTSVITLPGITSTLAILGANTFTGQQIISTNGAASTSPLLLNGTIFTGGSATTTKPQFLVEPTGTTSTGWSTSGTGFGVNAPSGFAGNLVDFQLNGASKFAVNSDPNTGWTAGGFTMILPNFGGMGRMLLLNNSGGIHLDGSSTIYIGSGTKLAWADSANPAGASGNNNGSIQCPSVGMIQIGENGAGPTSQHFKSGNRITSDGVGANLTISGGNGRGGAGGDLILASYTTAGSGVAGTLTTRWRIDAATGKLLPEANATYDLGGDTLNLSSVWSSAFYVGSDQVVGPRGAAVADAATGAATASFGDVNTALDGIATQLNDLLARVRIHGLIAP